MKMAILLSELIPFAANSKIDVKDFKQIIDQFIIINTGKISYYTQLFDNKYELFKKITEKDYSY
ncbi:hypothetical protein MHK_007065 [Candidatus Magnetomorum sp. HK-1]|nr:hypothetical protein MHK_007065 [Candidatus Magnetomorum sp. HK-1]